MKNLIPALLCLISFSTNAQLMFNDFSGTDIGNPTIKGKHSYNSVNQTFTLEGSGYNMWFARDAFYFVSKEIKGDFILSVNPEFIGNGVNPHRKMGLLIRATNEDNSVYMDAAIHGDGLTSLQYRPATGADTKEVTAKSKSPEFIQVERKENEFIMRISKDGKPLEEVGRVKMDMEKTVYAGMFVCSHDENVAEKAIFKNLRLEIPAATGVDGYQNPSASRLEILDTETGLRQIIFDTPAHIEAPNWSRNGKYLIYNSGGKLYKFDLKKRVPELLKTGKVVANNNDHGISFDGKTLAISSSADYNGKNQSLIFTVPATGGKPIRITEKGPSYWHGWSPDGKWLTYCAERNGNYDVYKIPSKGGEEIRLTSAEGLDDGPEYSPDGKFIYFNSTRTGSMHIWRMKPDGAQQEQVTRDGFRNWFAHPSPDGRWLIFISYLPEVPASSHPHNQRVMLRLMPSTGGEIMAIAFLYGGQGTINVPSWSPDSKKVAFVSFTY